MQKSDYTLPRIWKEYLLCGFLRSCKLGRQNRGLLALGSLLKKFIEEGFKK